MMLLYGAVVLYAIASNLPAIDGETTPKDKECDTSRCGVHESCKSQTYCTYKPEDYPQAVIDNLLDNHEYDFFTQPNPSIEVPREKRMSDAENDVFNCISDVTMEPLYKVRDRSVGEWRTVVQSPNFTQRIRLETCRLSISLYKILKHREALVERMNLTLKEVSDWGDANLVKFTATKTQTCLFTAKRSSFPLTPTFRGIRVSVSVTDSVQLLGINISSNLNFGQCFKSKAKTAGKKLGILNKVKQYFTPEQLLTLYQAQFRSCMEYCSHLWDGSAKYQLDALDSLDHRASRLIGDEVLVNSKLQTLEHRRKVVNSTGYISESVPKNFLILFLPHLSTIVPQGIVRVCIRI